MLPARVLDLQQEDRQMVAMIAVFVVAFVVGTFCSRLSVAGKADGSMTRGPVSSVVGYLANLATVVLLIWGFSVLAWYWTIGCLVVGGGAAQLAIPQMTWQRWSAIAPVLEVLVILATVALLVWHWPF